MTKAEIRRMNRATQELIRLSVASQRASARERKRQENLLIREIRAAELDTTGLMFLRARVRNVAKQI